MPSNRDDVMSNDVVFVLILLQRCLFVSVCYIVVYVLECNGVICVSVFCLLICYSVVDVC